MPPKQTAGAPRGRPKGSTNKKAAAKAPEPPSSDPFDSQEEQEASTSRDVQMIEDEEPEQEKTIPKDLLTRVLHEFFAKDATRISRDANAAVGKYFDVFVREAIARAAVEKETGFLEVCWLAHRGECWLTGDRLRIWRRSRRSCCLTSEMETFSTPTDEGRLHRKAATSLLWNAR